MAQKILSNKQSTTGSPYVYYTIEVTPSNRTLTTVDIAVTCKSHLASSSSSLGIGANYGITGKLTVNGVDHTWTIKATNKSWSGTTEYTSTTNFTVSNLAWDTTSLTAKMYAIRTSGSTSNAGYLKTTSCSNITIEKAAAPSAVDSVSATTTPNAPTIKWTPKDSSFKFKVKYTNSKSLRTVTSSLISPNTTSQYSYNGLSIPNEFFDGVQSETQTATATLYTYASDGTTQIGDPQTKTFTLTLNSNIKPSLGISNLTEAGDVPSNWGVYVQNKSKLSFRLGYAFPTPVPASATATASTNGQTFSSTSLSGTATFVTNYLKTSGSNTITASITDSRERTTNATNQTYTVLAYSSPTITAAEIYRCNSSGTADDNGKYIHYTFNANIYSLNQKNTHTFVLKYRVKGSSGNYTTILSSSGTLSNDKYVLTASATYGTGNTFDVNTEYEFVFVATDYFSSNAITKYMVSGFDLINFNASGKSMAFGKVSTRGSSEKALDVELTSYFNKTMYLYDSTNQQYVPIEVEVVDTW